MTDELRDVTAIHHTFSPLTLMMVVHHMIGAHHHVVRVHHMMCVHHMMDDIDYIRDVKV